VASFLNTVGRSFTAVYELPRKSTEQVTDGSMCAQPGPGRGGAADLPPQPTMPAPTADNPTRSTNARRLRCINQLIGGERVRLNRMTEPRYACGQQ
jgi:hypothetical protein